MKTRSINILIVSLLLLGVMAVMLIVLVEKAHDDFEGNITVTQNGETEKTLSVSGLKLNPTESREYSVNLVCLASGKYTVKADFEEKTDGGMKHFVNVTASIDGKCVYEGTLFQLLDGKEFFEFETELYEKDPAVLTIKYEMPYHIGNEAQGTFCDFYVHLSVKKK
jgi:hypothetical protein